jgi:hypothetical protein
MAVVVLMKLEHHTLMRTVSYIMDIHVLAREYHIFFLVLIWAYLVSFISHILL